MTAPAPAADPPRFVVLTTDRARGSGVAATIAAAGGVPRVIRRTSAKALELAARSAGLVYAPRCAHDETIDTVARLRGAAPRPAILVAYPRYDPLLVNPLMSHRASVAFEDAIDEGVGAWVCRATLRLSPFPVRVRAAAAAIAKETSATKGEQAILDLVADAVARDELAARLGITEHALHRRLNQFLSRVPARDVDELRARLRSHARLMAVPE